MSLIEIDSSVMRDKSKTLEGIAKNMTSYLEEIQLNVRSLGQDYEGEAAENTISKFEAIKEEFNNSIENLRDYSIFLNNAAQEWDNINSKNIEEANNILF